MSLRLAISTFVIAISSLIATSAMAADGPPNTANDEYDFSWLDPEKKIYVVQNRKYTKASKLEFSVAGGIGIGEPYRTRRTILPRAWYYINDNWGISLLAGFNSNSENDNMQALLLQTSRKPVVRDIQSFYGGSIVWLPFYGKINMFNQILYIDWHLEAGIGQVASEIDLNQSRSGNPRIVETNHMSFHWGTGQKFFITRNWAARLDFMAVYYSAPSGFTADGVATTDGSGVDETNDNYFVTLGLSYTF